MREKLRAFKRDKPRLYELGAYLVFGVLTTLVNWAVYLVLTAALGLSDMERNSGPYRLAATLSQVVAWILSVLFAYFTNRRYVFESDGRRTRRLREFWLFVSSRALGAVLFDLLLFNLFLLVMGDKPSKLIMNVLVVIFNYLASRFFIFSRREKPGPETGKKEGSP